MWNLLYNNTSHSFRQPILRFLFDFTLAPFFAVYELRKTACNRADKISERKLVSAADSQKVSKNFLEKGEIDVKARKTAFAVFLQNSSCSTWSRRRESNSCPKTDSHNFLRV